MADLNFPTSPSVNDIYSFGGKTWTWTGSYWRLQPTGAINNIPIGNTVPSTGTFTNLSATGNITGAYLYGNASTTTGVNKNQTFVTSLTPTGAIQGDVWINVGNGKQYSYFTDDNGSQWVELEAYQSYSTSYSVNNTNVNVDSFTGDGANVTFTLSTTPSSANVVSVNYNGATLLHDSFTISNANITFGSAPANGYKFDVMTLMSGNTAISAGGSNTQVQFNDNNVLGGSANFTFNKVTNTLNANVVTANGAPLATTGKAIAMSIVFGF